MNNTESSLNKLGELRSTILSLNKDIYIDCEKINEIGILMSYGTHPVLDKDFASLQASIMRLKEVLVLRLGEYFQEEAKFGNLRDFQFRRLYKSIKDLRF